MTSPLEDLLVTALGRLEDEGEAALAPLCAEHPEHAEALRRQIATLRELGLVPSVAGTSDVLPARLGRFTPITRIARGGMGVVYLARDEGTGRLVACKAIRPELLALGSARERFRREVETIARLDHPGIVKVLEADEAGDTPFFAMEHVAGCTVGQALDVLRAREPGSLTADDLAAVVARSSGADGAALLPSAFGSTWPDACAHIIEQIAAALHHAHERGILHRDVKPSNIMLSPDGRARLLDFGLAYIEGVTHMTRSGSELGSLPYMAPEQLHGDLTALDRRTDVYGVGVTLYEMLALRLPYEAASNEALRRLIVTGVAPAPRRLVSAGVALATVCGVAMDVEPRARYATAAALAADLARVREGQPVLARRPGVAPRVRRWLGRHPVVRGGLLAAAVTLTTGSVLFGLRERDMRASARRLLALVERLSHAVLAASRSLERSLLPTEVNLALLRQLREVDAELAQDGDDSSARLALRAEWLHALASAEEAIGQVTQAAQHVDEVLALRRELASRNPDATQDQASLSIAIVRVGDLLARTGQRTAATARYREALAIDERLAELHPDASLLDNLAWSYKRLAGMEAQGGQTMASIELYLRQFDAMRRAFALDQEGEVRLFGMCSTHHSILSCLSALEAPLAEHWAFATVALAWAARLNARAPHNMAYFETCHVIRHEAAAIAGQRGDAVQARRLLDENLNSARAAVTADPRGRVARSCLAAALTAYGAFSRAHGEALAAKALLDECLTLCRAWQQDTHCLPDLAGWVATACEERALLHVEHGEPTHAAQLLRLAMRTAATDLFRACILARLQALGFADDEERVALQRLLANLDRPEAGDELRRCADRISVHVRLSDHAEVARLQLRTSELAAPLLQRLRALLASK